MIDLIPYGRKNAVSRNQLRALTGLSDRMVRREIQKARETDTILSCVDGNGYYRPTVSEKEEIKEYIKREKSRAISTFKSMKIARAFLEDIEHGRV